MNWSEEHKRAIRYIRESLDAVKGGRFLVADITFKFPVLDIAKELGNFEYYIMARDSSPHIVIGQEYISYFDRYEQKTKTVPLRIPLR